MEETDPQLTQRQLAVGLWYLRNRVQVRKAGIVALIAVAALAWGFVLYGVVGPWYLQGRALDRDLTALVASGSERAAVVRSLRAAPLQVSAVALVPAGSGAYDAAVRVVNPNADHLAYVTVAITIPGAAAHEETGIVLPGRERWFVRLHAASPATPGAATTVLRRVGWNRIRVRDLGRNSAQAQLAERWNIAVTEAAFQSDLQRASFAVENRSAYSFRDVEAVVLLRRGDAITGINRVVLPALPAAQTVRAATTWFTPVFGTTVAVYPFANIFDPQSFVPL